MIPRNYLTIALKIASLFLIGTTIEIYFLNGLTFNVLYFSVFSTGFFIIMFMSTIIHYINKLRDKQDIKKSLKKNIKDKFKEDGGIVGFQQIKKEHKALIFVSNHRDNYADYNYKYIKPIIDDCKNKKGMYEIYFCYKADDFKKIVESKYVKEIHIFGHGRIDTLGFEDGRMYYRELRDVEPKELVAQWHCNHGFDRDYSLGKLIGKCYHVPLGYSLAPDISKNVQKLVDGEIKPTQNPKFKDKS